MRENRSSGSVGERQGNEPLYPENINLCRMDVKSKIGSKIKELREQSHRSQKDLASLLTTIRN